MHIIISGGPSDWPWEIDQTPGTGSAILAAISREHNLTKFNENQNSHNQYAHHSQWLYWRVATINPLIHAQKILRPVVRLIPSRRKCLRSTDIRYFCMTCDEIRHMVVGKDLHTLSEDIGVSSHKDTGQTVPPPNEHFRHAHLGLRVPLPHYDGFSHLLTCVDHFSRWCEALPMTDLTDNTTAKTFVPRWIALLGYQL